MNSNFRVLAEPPGRPRLHPSSWSPWGGPGQRWLFGRRTRRRTPGRGVCVGGGCSGGAPGACTGSGVATGTSGAGAGSTSGWPGVTQALIKVSRMFLVACWIPGLINTSRSSAQLQSGPSKVALAPRRATFRGRAAR